MPNYLLAAMKAWYDGHAELLRASGIEITLDRTKDDRAKHSQWIRASGPAAEVELIVWDTGEAESGIARSGLANIDEHHAIATVAQLTELLKRLVDSARLMLKLCPRAES